jgi:hypothetical protein
MVDEVLKRTRVSGAAITQARSNAVPHCPNGLDRFGEVFSEALTCAFLFSGIVKGPHEIKDFL